ncbi:hypothetical protein IFM58399_05726 [Aspergillus lentulus]|uniref:uncharacterized protein n=1 Tax=Aspergillus lentulus TaxID=293939 RepID=UPI001395674F|nr:uncharacterized protein IFM58399_05726 [Aspergillus lentulus]KAF4152778.1 hypothetical protein CNMCM6069_001603 [Aspergillus lentulus]GFF39860.1 hypothetical protein IFM58399_05726 [Aspergillus lentulus]GFF58022.1 hypothetical protein IFM62136_03644 [Aspergillus lentulus]
MRLQLFSFIYVAIFASIVSATGCSKCLNQNEDNIRLGCFNKCKEAFNPSSSEYHACRDQCTEFVFQDHCCTSSCSSKSNVCLNDYFHRVGLTKRDSTDEEAYYRSQLDAIRENPDLLDKRALLVGDAPYHLIRSTKDLHSLNHPDFSETVVYDVFEHNIVGALGRRIDQGQTCCWVAGAVLQRGITEIGAGWTSNDWTDEQRQGLVLVSFGVAAAYACNLVYNVQCLLFNARPAPQV